MVNITGGMVYYWFVCRKKLWYLLHNIEMESTSEDVLFGRELDRKSFSRELKHITVDNTISIDFISAENEIHESKKSKQRIFNC